MTRIRFLSAALAATCAFAAIPCSANELRIEARAGVIFVEDYDLGDTAFVGAEISADKVLVEDTDIYFGFSGRGGARIGENGKLFVAGGYTAGEGEDVWHAGGGYEHRIAGNIYLKAEYRHFFSDFDDADQLTAGIGVKF